MQRSKGRSGTTVSSDYFRELYRGQDDPWGFARSAYEREKYEATLGALPRERYASALELGCSVGVFTRMLAERCGDAPHVRFAAHDLAASFPRGRYELVTVCELGFYFGPRDLARIRDGVAGALEPGGDCVLVHWTPLVEGHAQTADDVHDAFLNDPRFERRATARAPTYRLDVVSRR